MKLLLAAIYFVVIFMSLFWLAAQIWPEVHGKKETIALIIAIVGLSASAAIGLAFFEPIEEF